MKHIAKFRFHFWVTCPSCGYINMGNIEMAEPKVLSINCKQCKEIIHNEYYEAINGDSESGGEVCEWIKTAENEVKTKCGNKMYTGIIFKICPWCTKPIKEV